MKKNWNIGMMEWWSDAGSVGEIPVYLMLPRVFSCVSSISWLHF